MDISRHERARDPTPPGGRIEPRPSNRDERNPSTAWRACGKTYWPPQGGKTYWPVTSVVPRLANSTTERPCYFIRSAVPRLANGTTERACYFIRSAVPA